MSRRTDRIMKGNGTDLVDLCVAASLLVGGIVTRIIQKLLHPHVNHVGADTGKGISDKLQIARSKCT